MDAPRRQQKTHRVIQDMPLDTLDLLACVIPGWIDAGPFFGATLWLSITQADGLASRPAAARHCTYSVYRIFSIVPSREFQRVK